MTKFLDNLKALHWGDYKTLFAIIVEYLAGKSAVRKHKSKSITIFGSARFSKDSHYYKEAKKLGYLLAMKGYKIVTGAGPGIMQASSEGAHEAGGQTIGFSIYLPHEKDLKPYSKNHVVLDHFYVRKLMLTHSSQAYVFMPGGLGTLDELFEVLTLMQTGKSKKLPVILYDRKFWDPMMKFIANSLIKEHTIHSKDLELVAMTDSVEEVVELIAK